VKTHILIDVDGVINAFAHTYAPVWDSFPKMTHVAGFSIRWWTEVIDRLHLLDCREDVEFFWLTTWEHDAPTELCPALGLRGEQWPVLVRDGAERSSVDPWWKFVRASEHFEEHSPDRLVWIDDDLAFSSSAKAWADLHPEVLLVAPAVETGLSPGDFKRIQQHLTA